jgi:anaphase-promoting complex subunit 2
MSAKTLNARKRRVFDSVFGKDINLSQPTPVTTPATGFTAPGQAFGAPLPLERQSPRRPLGEIGLSRVPSLGAEVHVEDQVRWDRAWHLITHTLSPPEFKANNIGLDGLKPEKGNLDSRFFDALADVIAPQTRLPLARQTEDIVGWYTGQVRYHFLHQVLQILLKLRDRYSQEQLLSKSFAVLRMAQLQYRHGLSFIVEGLNSFMPGSSRKVEEKFWRDLHAIVSNSVMEPLADALTAVLRHQVSTILGLPDLKDPESTAISPESEKTEKTRREMLELVEKFRYVGLVGEKFQVTFAEIMNNAMTEYVHRGCKGVWSPGDAAKDQTNTEERDISILPRTAHHSLHSRCVTQLCEWIENRYAKLAVQVTSILDTKASVTWADNEKYKEMSIGRLAELRINELFDIVVNWPHSKAALDDLRTAITTPQRRLHLTEVFAETLEEKLLHPGASTLQILQAYISMIWSFHALDHSKVLLDRVAYPLQLYLCSREDTVRIIITGLLSETEDAQGNPIKNAGDKLVELAHLLNDDSERFGQRANDEELDWHDMDWVPDPVDAGPGYKRSKNADVIGTLIGVLGVQEVFIKEFQNILGENLLKHDTGLEKQVYYPQ